MTLSLAEAQARLPELVRGLAPGEEVVITENDRAVARLVGPLAEPPRPVPGRGKGTLIIVADDDRHLEDFAEYMP